MRPEPPEFTSNTPGDASEPVGAWCGSVTPRGLERNASAMQSIRASNLRHYATAAIVCSHTASRKEMLAGNEQPPNKKPTSLEIAPLAARLWFVTHGQSGVRCTHDAAKRVRVRDHRGG